MMSELGESTKVSIVLKKFSLFNKEDHDLEVELVAISLEVSH